jgi:hypothetical protein
MEPLVALPAFLSSPWLWDTTAALLALWLVGYAAAVGIQAIRAKIREYDAGLDQVQAEVDAERHAAGHHEFPGARERCRICGARPNWAPFDRDVS